ncbi:hypothetical protein KKI96_20735, partial [Xenorhabdus bovienii]|nr:hypothetical protein [Xenorhabdus bovienii]
MLRDQLLLADAGYVDFAYFEQVSLSGGSFIEAKPPKPAKSEDGKQAVRADIEKLNRQLAAAAQNPLNPMTSQAISNQSHQTNEVNMQIGELNVNTQATDAQGVAKDVKGELTNQMQDLGQQTATGVAK